MNANSAPAFIVISGHFFPNVMCQRQLGMPMEGEHSSEVYKHSVKFQYGVESVKQRSPWREEHHTTHLLYLHICEFERGDIPSVLPLSSKHDTLQLNAIKR